MVLDVEAVALIVDVLVLVVVLTVTVDDVPELVVVVVVPYVGRVLFPTSSSGLSMHEKSVKIPWCFQGHTR